MKTRFRFLRLAPCLGVSLLCLWFTGCARSGGDLATLRNSVTGVEPAGWEKEIELGVGSWILGAARLGLAFVELEPEARCAIDAVRAAEVGVYKRCGSRSGVDRGRILISGDKAMRKRGMERVVTVMNRKEMVVVYARAQDWLTPRLQACVLVLNPSEMVVVSASTHPARLMDLAMRHIPAGEKLGRHSRVNGS